MKILVVGNGGREHAMCRALLTADPKPELFIAPGNPGTADCGHNVPISASSLEELVTFAKDEGIDLVIPGPELPLVLGLGDKLKDLGIPCCGPTSGPSQLEGSKAFTREVTAPAGIPGPKYEIVTTEAALRQSIEAWDGLPVVKADGLASGKGVFLPPTKAECLQAGLDLLGGSLGDAGRKIVLEERLEGIEASLFYACDGLNAVALPHARDHKRLLDGDCGPNTGGMGAISPNPLITEELRQQVLREVITPSLQALMDAGTPFRGFLFGGFMLTQSGPKLLEYNVRLGDPEAQAILPRLAPGEFLKLCIATAQGELTNFEVQTIPEPTCAIVLSANGYPTSPKKGDTINVGQDFETTNRWLIHAGTRNDAGDLVTNGGRVAAVVARGASAEEARTAAYSGIQMVEFQGAHYRTDIGAEKQMSEQT